MKQKNTPYRPALFGVAICSLILGACGESSGFSNKGQKPVKPESEPAPVVEMKPRGPLTPIQGYQDPSLNGADYGDFISDGSSPLGDPDDVEMKSTVTSFKNGNATQVGDLNSTVAQGGTPLTCPGGVIAKGHCYVGENVFKWRMETANDDSRVILSKQGDSCNNTDPVCKLLQESAVPAGFRTIDGVVFRSLRPDPDSNEARQGLVYVEICHGAVNTTGSESLLRVGEPCQPVKETFAGLREPAAGTVPAFLWKRGAYTLLSLDGVNRPAPDFQLSSATPVFHVMPAPKD